MADDYNKKSLEDIAKLASEILSPLESVGSAISNMIVEAQNLNQSFVGGKTRIEEMNYAIVASVASITDLGGSVADVTKTITEVAEGSRRNVIANEEQVTKLYASAKILDTSALFLTESFGKAGYEVSQIGVNIGESIEYVQSLGLNARVVTSEVVKNLDLMNRFNFNDGVQGLTKMAAQASMLRFDMRETANFADKVITPEGAINMSAAFQRLGLAVGSLGDPFKLMNDAINDPGALQDSLINATKQFTYFDEKTKSFKINPQGILTLREMAHETQISYETLTKSALAAADLDTRLSAINPSINFEDESDKMLLANIASMGKSGKYEVELKDNTKKELQNLNQEEFDELIDQQKNAPKTVEAVQKSQLGVLENIYSTLESAVNQLRYGAAGAKEVVSNTVGFGNIGIAIAKELKAAAPETKEVSGFINESLQTIQSLIMDKTSGKIDEKSFQDKFESLEKKFISSTENIGEATSKSLGNLIVGVKGTSAAEQGFRSAIEEFKKAVDTGKAGPVKTKIKTIPEVGGASVFGASGARARQIAEMSKDKDPAKSTTQKVDFSGVITVKIEAKEGVSVEYLNKRIADTFNSESFKQHITKSVTQIEPTKMKPTKK